MTHDDERRYHEREHAGFMSERRNFSTYTDLDVLREMALEREEKERLAILARGLPVSGAAGN